MKIPQGIIATFLLAAALMSGCASTDSRPASAQASRPGITYGVINAIEMVRGNSNGIGAGAIIGGVVGGVLGSQVGGGTGNDVATIAGVVGGAVAGHQIENSNRQQDAYRIQVRLDNGGYQTVMQSSVNDLRVGDRVRVDIGNVSRY